MMIIAPLKDEAVAELLQVAEQDDFFVFLETTRITDEDRYSYFFRDPVEKIDFRPGDDPLVFFGRVEEFRRQGYYLAGWFAYEFGYVLEPALAGNLNRKEARHPLAELGVFKRPDVIDHLAAPADVPASLPPREISPVGKGLQVGTVRPSVSRDQYYQHIAAIKRYIESGDTYQVNYTLKLLFDYAGSELDFYKMLRRNQKVGYGAYIKSGNRHILSFSPELFFRKKGDDCLVRPMKGTGTRGRTVVEDQRIAETLQHDAKNRSENVMIVDLLRNDLGRLCEMGTVQVSSLFDVAAFETLQQMTSTIKGRLRPGVSYGEIFQAIFPCGSVTGAPKIRTMEIIRKLEATARGVYTGGIGYIAPDGNGAFSVPIRTVVLENGQGEMGIGSGIVYDSDPADEWNECLLKGRFLTGGVDSFELVETILWLPGRGYWLLDFHLERLSGSAVYFRFPVDIKAVQSRLAALAEGFDPELGARRVRLLVDSEGEINVIDTPCATPRLEFFPAAAPEPVTELPVALISRERTDSLSTFLYHKTTNRALYNQEREQALAAGFYEVIFENQEGEITEGAITSIFVQNGSLILTPPVDCGLLDGVLKRYLIDRINVASAEEDHGLRIEERVLSRADLLTAEAVYVGNSVRGLVRVRVTYRS